MLKRFLRYYRPYLGLLIPDLLAATGVALLGVMYPIITRWVLNDLIAQPEWTPIILAGFGLLLLYLVRALLNYFVQYKGHVMGVRMQAQMCSDMFRHLERLSFRFYDEHETGRIMSRLTSDLFDVAELAHHGPETVLTCTISIIASFTYLATIHLPLALIIFCCVPFLMLVSMSLRMRMQKAFRESKQSTATVNGALQSSIAGIRVTKAFTNADKEQEKFEVGNGQLVQAQSRAYKAMGQFQSSTTFITDVFNVVVIIAGGLFMHKGAINFADYSAFIVSINLFLNPISTLIRFMESFQNGAAGFERFVEIMDTTTEQDEPAATALDRVKGEVEFCGVHSAYTESREVLTDVSFRIPPGKTFALVGPSGGGKTTVCHLIPHFYEISQGAIRIDGRDIRSLTRESLRRHIGIVQQDVYLFNASIRENILYGRLDATEQEVIEAAKRANIHEDILAMEKGYDTVIGERGVRLSGGQKQRLCIARVFLKNPPILILDEATSALDNATEMLIQQSLDQLSEGRTTIVVAHRLSTIKNADEIAVIDRGRILQQGTHEQLLERGGLYADLYHKQFKLL